jgi:hypothetical protein
MKALKSGNIITTHGGIIEWADIRVYTGYRINKG